MMRAPLALLAAALATLACRGEPPTARFAASLRARTPGGEPVAGVRAWADGRALGSSSDDGVLRAELRGREGATVELAAACPAAYRTEPASRRLTLRRVLGASAAASSQALQLDVRCMPIEISAALVVLANGRAASGLPLRVQGEVLGQTGPDGSAHLLVTAPADSTVRVEIDTSARPELRPRNPVHTFRIQNEDSILFLEQSFELAPRVAPARRRIRPTPAPRRPQRID